MKLVVVESPGKIKKIQSALGSDYKLASSIGHIIDLPAKSLSVDVDNNFEPTYKTIPGKSTVIKDLQNLAKKCSEVIIASDKDREGEMIGWSIAKVLKLKDPKRIEFTNLSKEALIKAIQNPGKIDLKMVDAQKARRVLDRIVGYYLSPLLWQNVQPGLSAGRVQSVAVRVIVEREKEIRDFLENKVPNFYRIRGEFTDKSKSEYASPLYKKGEKSIAKIDSKTAHKMMNDMTESKFKVTSIDKTKSTKNPGKPFTTSTLTQEAGRKLGFTVKRTMQAAQNLYDASLITYMRTDETVLSNEIINKSKEYIIKKFGNNYHHQRQYSKGKNTQGAHEAIRPTDINKETVNISGKVKFDEQKLYSLIWKRTVSSQMAPAIFDVTTLVVEGSRIKDYDFRTTFNAITFPGFMAVYNVQNIEGVEETEDIKTGKLPAVGSALNPKEIVANTEFDTPPPRYDEPSFVAKLDPEKGLNIGRPATYVQLVSRIQEKNYVEKRDNEGKKFKGDKLTWKGKGKIEKEETETILGGDKNRLTPTPLGELVTEYLVKKFPTIMDYQFTSGMEESLDKVAEGTEKWQDVIKNFYDKFVPIIEKVKKEKSMKETKVRLLGQIDGEDVYVRFGKYGSYVQQGDSKIKKAPVKPPLNFDSVKLSDAKKLLEYPIILGKIGAKQVLLKSGKHGLYVNIGKQNISIDKKNITIEEVKKLLEETNKDNSLANFKEDTKVYKVLKGPYGLFVNVTDTKNKKIKYNASIPEGTDTNKLTLEDIKKFIEDYFEKKRNRFKKKKN